MKITETDFCEAREEYKGYCIRCDDITNECGVEPDAEHYPCSVCERTDTVMGIENAILMGFIVVEERPILEGL